MGCSNVHHWQPFGHHSTPQVEKNEQQPMLLHHLFPSPARPQQSQRRAISRAQALKLLPPVDRDILTTVTVSRHIYVSDGSYSCPIPALPPPETQTNIPGIPRTECHGSLCFPTKQPLSHPGNCGELSRGKKQRQLPSVPAFPDQCPPHSNQHRQTKSCLK